MRIRAQVIAQLLGISALIMLATIGVAAAKDALWDRPPLSATPDELLQAFAAIPVDPEHGVQVLFEEGRYSFDDEGRINYQFRVIYRVDSPGSVAGWSRISRSWQPWHQQRPVLQARTVLPDGVEHRFDPTNAGEYSDGDDGPNVYSDSMTLRGPLPAVDVGAIIEEHHEVQDIEPMFEGGTLRAFIFGQLVPVGGSRLIVEVPETMPFRHRAYRLPGLKTEREDADGRTRWSFAHGALASWELDVSLAPGSVARRPVVRFSTGESWKAVATNYSTVVDGRIAGSDLRKVVRKISRGEKGRLPLIERALAYVHEQVRYTGVEFGERSLVPEVPEQTLSRRFGDCKDKSTLLVALLREAGVDANVALLRTGPASDVDEELPGIGRFDHAIVYLPGDTPLWIDPTDPYARAGELPDGDQDRLALVADETTTALTRTPRSLPEENVRREHREVFLSPLGSARIVETTTVTGSIERTFRHSFGSKNETGLHEQLENYAKSHYKAERLATSDVPELDDLSAPMTVRLDVEQSGKALTDERRASAAISVGALVRDLPQLLKKAKSDDEDDETPARQDPLALELPFVAELNYVIHPPAGFQVLTLPESGSRTFGPSEMTQTYAIREDGVVTADVRYHSGPTVYTVEQIDEARVALAEFFAESEPLVMFHQVGESHLEAGRLREAIEAFRALVTQAPDEPLNRTRVARAYLAAGLGVNARREARRAVELSPDSMRAHRTLGLILAHDELGRKFSRGFDREGSERALRRAHELDDEDFTARGELAILLEHPADGRRYGPGSDLAGALDEYRSLRDELENDGLTSNLLATLLHTAAFEELRTTWDDAPRNATRDALYLAATAALDGAPAAIEKATSITGGSDSFSQALTGAGDWLVTIRRYPEAAALLAAGARGASDAVAKLTRADHVKRTKRHDDLIVADGPANVVRSLFQTILLSEKSDELELERWFDPSLMAAAGPEQDEFYDGLREGMTWMAAQGSASPEAAVDAFLSLATFTTEGDESTGWRVTLRVPPAPGGAGTMRFYLVPTDAGPRLASLGPMRDMAGLLMLRWLDEERSAPVVRWLDWLAEDAATERGEDPLSVAPLSLIWTYDAKDDPVRMRGAAASLMIHGLYRPQAAEALDALDEAFPGEGPPRVGLELARVRAAGSSEDYEAQLAAATRLAATHPQSVFAFQAQAAALMQLERFDEADALIRARLEERPYDMAAITLYSGVPQSKGEFGEQRRRLQEMIDAGRASGFQYNNLAWLDIVDREVDQETLQFAQQSVNMTEYAPSSMHTLATVYAELGHVAEARDVLLALVGNRTSDELEPHDWYVLGLIAENYGVPEAAVEAYEHVEPPDDGQPDGTSTFVLARRRIDSIRSPEDGAKE